MNDDEATIGLPLVLDYGRGFIRASVVDNDEFKITERLIQYGLDALFEIFFAIINR
jgi:hypothetical protein